MPMYKKGQLVVRQEDVSQIKLLVKMQRILTEAELYIVQSALREYWEGFK
jgi:hypothetical protein